MSGLFVINRTRSNPRSDRIAAAAPYSRASTGQAECRVRGDGVETAVLEGIGSDLVGEPDTAPLLAQVDQDAGAFGSDRGQGPAELLPAVAAERAEDVPGPALRMDTDEGHVDIADIPMDERDGLRAVTRVGVHDRVELADPGR